MLYSYCEVVLHLLCQLMMTSNKAAQIPIQKVFPEVYTHCPMYTTHCPMYTADLTSRSTKCDNLYLLQSKMGAPLQYIRNTILSHRLYNTLSSAAVLCSILAVHLAWTLPIQQYLISAIVPTMPLTIPHPATSSKTLTEVGKRETLPLFMWANNIIISVCAFFVSRLSLLLHTYIRRQFTCFGNVPCRKATNPKLAKP